MEYIDIHAHLNFPDFDIDREEVINDMFVQSIGAINIGTSLETSKEVLSLAKNHQHLWAIVGIHPHEALKNHDLTELLRLAHEPEVVGIGECGLDYFRLTDRAEKKIQQKLFEDQIAIAQTVGKPLMLHIRDSYREVLDILSHYPAVPAHAHFFAGDKNIAKEFLDRGDTISFTGVVTFTNDYDEVIEYVPADRLLAETDCPYVAPVPFRGKRNDPRKVVLVVQRLAEIKKMTETDLAEILIDNAKRTFKL